MKLVILGREKLREFFLLLDELVIPLLDALYMLSLLPLLLIHRPFPFLELLPILGFLPIHLLKVLLETEVPLGFHGTISL